MGRLRQITNGVRPLKPAIRRHVDTSGHRQTSWREWYKTPEWKALKRRVHLRDLFTCQREGCGLVLADPRQRIADHRIPHRGDRARFFCDDNVWTLCKPCHDGWKQQQERSLNPPGGGSNL